MTEDNRDVWNSYVQAWLEGETEELASELADDLILHQSGNHPLAGDFRGKKAYFELLAAISRTGTDVQILDLGYMELRDDDAAMTIRQRFRNGDDVVETNRTFVHRIEGGHITQMWITDEDQAAVDAFFTRHAAG